jgi:autotransporter-associated beta strand protein
MKSPTPPCNSATQSARRLLGLLALASAGATAHAQTTLTWNNTGSDPKLSTSWVGNPTPGNSSSNVATGNIWSFSNTAPGNNAVTLTNTRNIFGIEFTSTANTYTISGSFALSTGATGITNNLASNTQTITSPITTGASQTWTTVAGGTLSVGTVNITSSTSNRTLTIAGAGNTSIGSMGFIAGQTGVGSLTKTGAGTLTLTGTNTYAGTTTINEGTVNIANGNSSSANANFTLSLGTVSGVSPVLKLSHVNALATSATLTGAGSSTNVGTVDLAAAGTYTLGSYLGNSIKFSASSGGATTLNFTNNSVVTSGTNGGRTITNADANLSLVFDGSLDISSSTAGSGVTFAGAGNTTVNGAIFNGIGQTRTVTKNDAGTLNLSAVNTYEGNTTIANGTLALTGAGAISGSPVITNNGIFNVSAVTGGNYTLGAGQTYVGSGTTIGNLTLNGAFTPGTSPGLATFNNNLTLGSTSTTTMEIGGSTTAGTDYDRVSVAGALTYGGTLNIVAFDLGGGAYNFAQTASFNLFGSGSRSGNFTSVSVGGTALADAGNLGVWTASAGGFDYTFSTSNGVLGIAAPIPEPAASAALGGAALLGLAALRRRRRG